MAKGNGLSDLWQRPGMGWDGRLLQCGIVKYKAKSFKEIYPTGGREEQEIAQPQEMGQAK